ncbi:predicted protein [Histoplasma capsulatum G186AR]|uniref:Uncharacterized protein n=1 Tax=Ajellomyces capsulatus (strain G186AR / H82 / ATCC MYA-2454 / RMSCC 2432) TaxID=447093 RepID=C0NZ87_AJECG|nr:uncharacterized protein HCBG_08467 [Histoplasma capsulatum G186AR]EEH03135.1 predicted protein [Histoplasma capsulatum G186AR]
MKRRRRRLGSASTPQPCIRATTGIYCNQLRLNLTGHTTVCTADTPSYCTNVVSAVIKTNINSEHRIDATRKLSRRVPLERARYLSGCRPGGLARDAAFCPRDVARCHLATPSDIPVSQLEGTPVA